jgi:type I restriction enzyme S subunit
MIKLDRGRVISSIDLVTKIGEYPVYSSSAQNNGYFGSYGLYDFDEELITWSVDGGGYFFYRPKHKFSVTNVSGILRILNTEKINYKFIYYLFCFQHTNQIFDYVDKAHPSVIKKRYFIPTIDVAEQQAIAKILSKTDQAIAKTEALIAKYSRIKTGLMQDLLTKGIDENGNIRSEQTHEFKDSPLGRIPKEWDVFPINKFCELIVDCKNRTSPFVDKSDYPVIRTSNIKNGSLEWDDMKYTDYSSYKIWTQRAIPQPGDVIITREAPLGQTLKIPVGLTPVLGQRTMLYRVNPKKLLSDFLVYLVMDERMQKYLNSICGGSTVHHLKVGEMREFLIAVPSTISEQNSILDLLTNTQNNIYELKEKTIKLQYLKTGLMQDLLTGKVRVKI